MTHRFLKRPPTFRSRSVHAETTSTVDQSVNRFSVDKFKEQVLHIVLIKLYRDLEASLKVTCFDTNM